MKIAPHVVEWIDGAYRRFDGPPREVVQRMSTKATVHREDGSVTEIEVEPYAIKTMLNPIVVQQLIADGIWTIEDLTMYEGRLALSKEFNAEPNVGYIFEMDSISYIVKPDNSIEVVLNQILTPPVATVQERVHTLLSDYGLTKEELLTALAPATPVVEENAI